jgi:hypothetical protein
MLCPAGLGRGAIGPSLQNERDPQGQEISSLAEKLHGSPSDILSVELCFKINSQGFAQLNVDGVRISSSQTSKPCFTLK